MSDHLLSVHLASVAAEVGDAFRLSISRAPEDGKQNTPGFGRVRAIRVHLEYETDGRGDTDSLAFPAQRVPIDKFGMGSADLEIPIPSNAPISYTGQLMSIRYWLQVTTDIEKSLDRRREIPVLVVPKNGAGTYIAAHPLGASPD